MSNINPDVYHSILHDLKEMSLGMQNIKEYLRILDERIDYIEHEYLNTKIKLAHRCPVCNGCMFDKDETLCLPCDGRGIVWG